MTRWSGIPWTTSSSIETQIEPGNGGPSGERHVALERWAAARSTDVPLGERIELGRRDAGPQLRLDQREDLGDDAPGPAHRRDLRGGLAGHPGDRSHGAAHRAVGRGRRTRSPGNVTRISASRCQLAGVVDEQRGGAVATLRREQAEPARPERAPVHRHDDPWPDDGRRLSSLVRVHVPGPVRQTPATDRQQGDVRRPEPRHLGEDLGVAGEVDPSLGPLEEEAQSRRRRPEGWPHPGMVGPGRPDGDPAEAERLAGHELEDLVDPVLPQQIRAAARRDDRWVAVDEPQGRHVQVVEVEMRDEDEVDVAIGVRCGCGPGSDQRADDPAQGRIGQDPEAIELDQEGRMAEEVEARLARHVGHRSRVAPVGLAGARSRRPVRRRWPDRVRVGSIRP